MELLKPLIALLAIVNPVGVVPFFIHFTQTLTAAQRRRSFTAFIVIAASALAGCASSSSSASRSRRSRSAAAPCCSCRPSRC
jgi:small neutral amino acid transporter SnatA (MarC family)